MAGSGGAPREHRLQPGDTLAGLALRYGVTMEQIQRANRLYSSDTIFLRATLLIPPRHRQRPGDRNGDSDNPGDNPGDRNGDNPGDNPGDPAGDRNGDNPGDNPGAVPRDIPGLVPGPSRRDLSAADFLRRLDTEIGRCKEAAAQRLRGWDDSPGPGRGGRSPSSPRGARLGPRPLTRTPRTAALRDCEDEIFTL